LPDRQSLWPHHDRAPSGASILIDFVTRILYGSASSKHVSGQPVGGVSLAADRVTAATRAVAQCADGAVPNTVRRIVICCY